MSSDDKLLQNCRLAMASLEQCKHKSMRDFHFSMIKKMMTHYKNESICQTSTVLGFYKQTLVTKLRLILNEQQINCPIFCDHPVKTDYPAL